MQEFSDISTIILSGMYANTSTRSIILLAELIETRLKKIRKAISIQYIGDAYVMYAYLLSDCLPIPQD